MNYNEKLLTVKEVAELLQVNSNTVYTLINKGHIKTIKLGRIKIPHFELTRFINENLGGEVVI